MLPKIVSTAVAAASLMTLAPTSAQAASTHVYVHGQWLQAHASTMANCLTMRTSALTGLTKAGATNVYTGACHANNYAVNGVTRTGYTYDMSYTRTTAFWSSDVVATTTPAYLSAGRSFTPYRHHGHGRAGRCRRISRSEKSFGATPISMSRTHPV